MRTDSPPVIDGRLDEEVWNRAARVTDFHQVRPNEYSEPSQGTEVFVLYDDDALYVGARLWDTEPERITANILRQGARLGFNDDKFGVIVGPFDDGQTGYLFDFNPHGVRNEAIYQDGVEIVWDWSGIYYAQATRDEYGWVAEMAIPFKTLSFDPNRQDWGINFYRVVAREREMMGWMSHNRDLTPSSMGLATGLEGMQQGLGLDLVAGIALHRNRDYAPSASDFRAEPSLDVFYKLTPGLNASLTFNTDFSGTEVDQRQIDLSRFSLFFPERRDFFLRDSDIFEFGRLSGVGFGGPTFSRPTLENGRPFFSRVIGLSTAGEPVDLIAGGKLSGRVGGFNVGALGIRQDAHGTADASNLLVARGTVNVLAQSAVGVIVTRGDPRSNTGNSLVGMDFRYLNTRLGPGRQLEGEAWFQRSSTDGLRGREHAYGSRLRMTNTTGLRGGVGIKVLEENFNPALGFVNRTGIRDQTLELGYTHRYASGFSSWVFAGMDVQLIDTLSGGRLQSQTITLRPLELENRGGDSIQLRYHLNEENLSRPFEISKGVVLPPGRYSFEEYQVNLSSAQHRPLSGKIEMRAGDFYSGNRWNVSTGLGWRPSPHFNGSVDYEYNNVRLPQGDFDVHLTQTRIEIVFSSHLSWVNLLQYDNVSESVGLHSRLHWVPRPEQEAFLVFNHTLTRLPDDGYRSSASEAIMSVNYTFRY